MAKLLAWGSAYDFGAVCYKADNGRRQQGLRVDYSGKGPIVEPMEETGTKNAMSADDAQDFMIAAIVFRTGDPVNDILAEVVNRLKHDGCDVTGILQTRVVKDPDSKPEVGVHEIRDGWDLPILEYRGSYSKGCRLDPRAITEVARRLELNLDKGADLMVINRFGKSEAEGYGLRSVLERAFVEGVAVLVAVREDYKPDWDAFHGGMAADLPPDVDQVMAWCRQVWSRREAAE